MILLRAIALHYVSVPLRGKEGAGPMVLESITSAGKWVSVPLRGKEGAGQGI